MKEKEAQSAHNEASYYQLHTQAIDDLVGATHENTPQYSKTELEKYKGHKLKLRLPDTLKVFLIKYWFFGALCFFVFMGLQMYIGNALDLFFIAALACGMMNDLLVNRFLRFTEKMPGGSNAHLMVTKRGMSGFLLNLCYGIILLGLVTLLYYLVNLLLSALFVDTLPVLHIGPLVFALFATLCDFFCLCIKRLFIRMIADAREN